MVGQVEGDAGLGRVGDLAGAARAHSKGAGAGFPGLVGGTEPRSRVRVLWSAGPWGSRVFCEMVSP